MGEFIKLENLIKLVLEFVQSADKMKKDIMILFSIIHDQGVRIRELENRVSKLEKKC